MLRVCGPEFLEHVLRWVEQYLTCRKSERHTASFEQIRLYIKKCEAFRELCDSLGHIEKQMEFYEVCREQHQSHWKLIGRMHGNKMSVEQDAKRLHDQREAARMELARKERVIEWCSE